MIRTVLVDDEREGLDVLEYDLGKLDLDILIVGKFDAPREALEFLRNNTIDVLLLDIEMPWMSGFELLDQLGDVPFKVIFVTAYDQYAVQAFRYYAIDYLLKPVTREQLKEAVTRVVSGPSGGRDSAHFKELMAMIDRSQNQFKRFVVPTLEGYELIEIADIIRCQADNNYVNVFLADGSRILMSRSLKYVQGILEDHDFFRTHQSHLINLQHVKRYIKTDGGQIIMSDNSTVGLSRGKKDEFVQKLKRLL